MRYYMYVYITQTYPLQPAIFIYIYIYIYISLIAISHMGDMIWYLCIYAPELSYRVCDIYSSMITISSTATMVDSSSRHVAAGHIPSKHQAYISLSQTEVVKKVLHFEAQACYVLKFDIILTFWGHLINMQCNNIIQNTRNLLHGFTLRINSITMGYHHNIVIFPKYPE